MIRKLARLGLSVGLAFSAAMAAQIAVPAVALAQSGCVCTLQSPASGPVGSISQANGDVFKTGASGLDDVGEGADINVGDVISTGASSSVTVSLGGGCNLALGPSSQISIAPVNGKLCVRVLEEPVGGGLGDGGAGVILAGAGALTVGGGLLIGLGLTDPASD